MAEEEQQEEADETTDDSESEESPKKKLLSGKVIVMAVGGLVLLGGGGAGVWFSGLLDGGGGDVAEVEEAKPALFYEMPEMLVNLSNTDSRRQYLKLVVSLEMSSSDAHDAVSPMLPRIMDIFQIYLRELRSEDLEGSAGVYRLKEELLRRINLVLSPHRIDGILFREMLVQ